jgi:hypothetical protein
MLPTTPARATHDYPQRDPRPLRLSPLNLATGTVISDIRKTHTTDDFIALLNILDRVRRVAPRSRGSRFHGPSRP